MCYYRWMYRGLAGVVIIAFFVALSACATATRSPSDDRLFIDSSPPGASIYVDGLLAGTTPRTVLMPRDHEITVRCGLAGYRDETTKIYRGVAPATQLDSPLFALVDELSGAAYRLTRSTLFVELTPRASAPPP